MDSAAVYKKRSKSALSCLRIVLSIPLYTSRINRRRDVTHFTRERLQVDKARTQQRLRARPARARVRENFRNSPR